MDLPGLVHLAVALVASAAALHDLAARTIPNWSSAVIALAGVGLHLQTGDLPGALLAAVIVFVVAFLAWRFGLMGGGDVKLLSACALAAPAGRALDLVLATALAGGVLALIYLALCRLVPVPALVRPPGLAARALRAEMWRIRRRGPLPYGVAIALGAFFTLLG